MKKQNGSAAILVVALILAVEGVWLLAGSASKSEGGYTPYNDIHRYEDDSHEGEIREGAPVAP